MNLAIVDKDWDWLDAREMPSSGGSHAPLERRARRRLPVRLMLSVECGEELPRPAILRDASEKGISFFYDEAIPPGSPIQFTVQVPPEVAEFEHAPVRGKGKVVRNEPQGSGRVLIAAVTDKYEFQA